MTDTPIGTRFVRNAVAACYQFVPISLYSSTFLLANSPNYFGDLNGWTIENMSSIYHRLIRYREECFAWLEKLALAKDLRLDPADNISALLERGNRHLQIYNFFDAEACFRQAFGLLAGAGAERP